MRMSHLVPELRELLAADDRAALAELGASTPPSLLGEILSALEPDEIWRAIGPLASRLRAEIFSYVEPARQLEVVERIGRRQLASLMDDMNGDDRADFYKRLDPTVAEEMLPLMARAEREDLKRLARAEEGTVGAVMNTDYVTLRPELTVAEALVQVRHEAPDSETIYYTYVVDGERRLIGFVSLKDLILARPHRRVGEVMREQVIRVKVGEDQEEAAALIERHDLVALPVVDADERLVGIVTHDDALDIVREEHAEDLDRFMGMTGPVQDLPYLQVPFWVHSRRRVTWLVGLLAVGLGSSVLLEHFEGAERAPGMYQALTIYVPMLANTGGNAGQQSVTTVMRSLILDQITPADFWRVLAREVAAAALLSAAVALVVYVGVRALASGDPDAGVLSGGQLAGVVTLALAIHIVVSAMLGASLPILAARLKLDPTVVASPALTTLADLTGLVIYFQVAFALLA